jgi:hypothetical protein
MKQAKVESRRGCSCVIFVTRNAFVMFTSEKTIFPSKWAYTQATCLNIGELVLFFSKFAATCRLKNYFISPSNRDISFFCFSPRFLTKSRVHLLICVAFSSEGNLKKLWWYVFFLLWGMSSQRSITHSSSMWYRLYPERMSCTCTCTWLVLILKLWITANATIFFAGSWSHELANSSPHYFIYAFNLA